MDSRSALKSIRRSSCHQSAAKSPSYGYSHVFRPDLDRPLDHTIPHTHAHAAALEARQCLQRDPRGRVKPPCRPHQGHPPPFPAIAQHTTEATPHTDGVAGGHPTAPRRVAHQQPRRRIRRLQIGEPLTPEGNFGLDAGALGIVPSCPNRTLISIAGEKDRTRPLGKPTEPLLGGGPRTGVVTWPVLERERTMGTRRFT